MGNKQVPEYKTLIELPVDQTVSPIQTDTDIRISTSLLRSMNDLTCALQKATTVDHFNDFRELVKDYESDPICVPSWYDESVLLRWYEINLNLLVKGDEKSRFLAEIMPKNETSFLWRLYHDMAPIYMLKEVAKKIPVTQLNSRGETFLFQIPKGLPRVDPGYDAIANYITNVILEIQDLPLNHISNNHETFIVKLFRCSGFWDITRIDIDKLLDALSQKGFAFQNKHQSIISNLITIHPDKINAYCLLVRPESYDITQDCEWIQVLYRKYSLIQRHNYVYYILHRNDYLSFLYNIYINREYYWGSDYIRLIQQCANMDFDKVLHMLSYTNKNGNTVIHKMAKRHDKLLLTNIIGLFGNKLTIKPNSKGFLPNQLYLNSKLSSLLPSLKTSI